MITWKDLLKEIINWDEPIRVIHIQNHYDMVAGEASARINKLRHWGLVKYADIKKKGFRGFIVTDYGRKVAKKREK